VTSPSEAGGSVKPVRIVYTQDWPIQCFCFDSTFYTKNLDNYLMTMFSNEMYDDFRLSSCDGAMTVLPTPEGLQTKRMMLVVCLPKEARVKTD
jgi:hypothetical protein